jgi:hypothetical protein
MDPGKDDFTFAKLSDITLPITFRMCGDSALLLERSVVNCSARSSRALGGHLPIPSFWRNQSCAFMGSHRHRTSVLSHRSRREPEQERTSQSFVGPLRDLPVDSRQQASHHPLPHFFQGIQECVHVCALARSIPSPRLTVLSWNEWITFPVRYCDLPLNAQITFTVWDIAGPRNATPVGGSTFRLFGKKWYVLSYACHLWVIHVAQDPSKRQAQAAPLARKRSRRFCGDHDAEQDGRPGRDGQAGESRLNGLPHLQVLKAPPCSS